MSLETKEIKITIKTGNKSENYVTPIIQPAITAPIAAQVTIPQTPITEKSADENKAPDESKYV